MLLAGVLMAGVVLHAVTGHALTGSPVPAVVPPPPVAGACVLALPPPPSGLENASFDYPSAIFGGCAGSKIGEVMSVDLTDHALAAATVEDYQQASSLCEFAEVHYVGWIGPFDPATLAVPGIGWVSDVTVESLSIGPTALQRAAGQRWTACVGASRIGVDTHRPTYRGTLARALSEGTLPPQFATCWRALTPSTEQQTEVEVPCWQPHAVEVLALTQITDPTTTPTLIAESCRGMAARSMRTADPTVGGRLEITAYSMDGASVMPLDSRNMLAGFTGCLASVPAPLRLQDTVIGLGGKPLPLIR